MLEFIKNTSILGTFYRSIFGEEQVIEPLCQAGDALCNYFQGEYQSPEFLNQASAFIAQSTGVSEEIAYSLLVGTAAVTTAGAYVIAASKIADRIRNRRKQDPDTITPVDKLVDQVIDTVLPSNPVVALPFVPVQDPFQLVLHEQKVSSSSSPSQLTPVYSLAVEKEKASSPKALPQVVLNPDFAVLVNKYTNQTAKDLLTIPGKISALTLAAFNTLSQEAVVAFGRQAGVAMMQFGKQTPVNQILLLATMEATNANPAFSSLGKDAKKDALKPFVQAIVNDPIVQSMDADGALAGLRERFGIKSSNQFGM